MFYEWSNSAMRGGDPSQADFEQVFLPHLDAAYNLARWLLRNDQDAEDAVQEAYLRAYKAFRPLSRRRWQGVVYDDLTKCLLHDDSKNCVSRETPELFDEEIHQTAGEPEMREAFQQKANAETLHCGVGKTPRRRPGKSSCYTISKVSPTRRSPLSWAFPSARSCRGWRRARGTIA